MEKNVQRFDGRAADYARYRERYAPEVVLPRFREWCGLTPEWTIADVGAGTGMLSDVFLANGNRVIAVEPNAEMRRMCVTLHEGSSRLEVVDGAAEATGLGNSSVEIVAAGRAFHWFDVERAAAEFRRIMRPDGWFASVAFGRSQTGREENEAFEQLLRRYAADHQASTHAAYELYGRIKDFFGRDYHHEEILGTTALDWEELYGLTMSLSHSPLSDDPRHGEFERELRAYFDRYAVDGRVVWQTRYWINAGKFAT